MSDTIQITSGYYYDKNGRQRQGANASQSIAVAGNGAVENVYAVPYAGGAIPLGSVTIPGFGMFRNAGWGWIKVGTKDGAGAFVPFAKLYANSAEATFDSPANQVTLDEDTITGTNVLYATCQESSGNWATGTGYTTGMIVTDSADSSKWVCLVAHTSLASGVMDDDRVAHPTYWLAYQPLLDYALTDR